MGQGSSSSIRAFLQGEFKVCFVRCGDISSMWIIGSVDGGWWEVGVVIDNEHWHSLSLDHADWPTNTTLIASTALHPIPSPSKPSTSLLSSCCPTVEYQNVNNRRIFHSSHLPAVHSQHNGASSMAFVNWIKPFGILMRCISRYWIMLMMQLHGKTHNGSNENQKLKKKTKIEKNSRQNNCLRINRSVRI